MAGSNLGGLVIAVCVIHAGQSERMEGALIPTRGVIDEGANAEDLHLKYCWHAPQASEVVSFCLSFLRKC
jgi:hypothetical protein